jgi:multisubunit Na+/H+ antiporter MnhG subunit
MKDIFNFIFGGCVALLGFYIIWKLFGFYARIYRPTIGFKILTILIILGIVVLFIYNALSSFRLI